MWPSVFYEFGYVCNTQHLQSPPPKKNPKKQTEVALGICLVHVLKSVLSMFQNMRPGRTKFSRGSSPWGRTTRLPEAATPEGPLAAINSLPTMEAFTDLSYLKTFYKQGHKASRRGTSRVSTEHSSVGWGGRWSWPREQRGERRLPKFLFPTFPRRPEDVRKEEMK